MVAAASAVAAFKALLLSIVAVTGQKEDSTDAFKYFYPLVLINLTRTNLLKEYVEAGALDGGVNMLAPSRVKPDSNFTAIVKPNVDTLYITSWLDLSVEPLVLGVPAISDRFYMVQLMDSWSNSFASPGTRTTGTKAGHFALCGPSFQGSLPKQVTRIDSPTNIVWLLARLQVKDAADDIDKVHALQDKFSLTFLSKWIKEGDAAKQAMVPDHSKASASKPPEVVDAWTAEEYFGYAAELMKTSPPPSQDSSMVKGLNALGIHPGSSLQWKKLSLFQQGALNLGKATGKAAILLDELHIATVTNGWRGLPDTIGNYGTDYETRAAVAALGLGANKPEDACYRVNNLNGGRSYKVHFESSALPPVHAFWSLTAYTTDGYLVPNSIDRYSRGSESNLHRASDGSVTVYLQPQAPSAEEELQNWLPVPLDGSKFVITARFYYPDQAIINGTWVLPAVLNTVSSSVIV